MLSTSSIAFSKGPHFDAFACCSFLSPEESLTQAATCDANKRSDKSYMQVNGDSPHVSHQKLHVVTYIHFDLIWTLVACQMCCAPKFFLLLCHLSTFCYIEFEKNANCCRHNFFVVCRMCWPSATFLGVLTSPHSSIWGGGMGRLWCALCLLSRHQF